MVFVRVEAEASLHGLSAVAKETSKLSISSAWCLVIQGVGALHQGDETVLEKNRLRYQCKLQRMLFTPTIASGRISFSSRPEPNTHMYASTIHS